MYQQSDVRETEAGSLRVSGSVDLEALRVVLETLSQR
jgi:hypothetical protein